LENIASFEATAEYLTKSPVMVKPQTQALLKTSPKSSSGIPRSRKRSPKKALAAVTGSAEACGGLGRSGRGHLRDRRSSEQKQDLLEDLSVSASGLRKSMG